MCENLTDIGIKVTLVERSSHVTSGLDKDMAIYVEEHLKKNGVNVIKDASVVEIKDNKVLLKDGKEILADMVLISTGVKPNTALVIKAGIQIGVTGAIKVNEQMMTSVKSIYACGDCIE